MKFTAQKSTAENLIAENPIAENPIAENLIAERAVPIQLSRKSRPQSTHLKKPSPVNPSEKAVPSQPI
jgi:hypothetical protein